MSSRPVSLLLLGGILAAFFLPFGRGDDKKPRSPLAVSRFSLKDPRDQKTISLEGLKDKKAIVVVFLGTECPINNAFLPELARLHEQYKDKGVQFLGINSNDQDTPTEVAQHAERHKVPFPVLKDPGNVVADQFGAERTPEAFVLDPSGKVLYRGRIDDQFGIDYQRAGKPKRRDLAEALDEALAGKPVSVTRTPVAGCVIGRVVKPRDEGAITFTKHVVPILQNNCQECHRPGQIGPMPLIKYRDVVAWSGMIREVVAEKRMPPWFADPRHGKFSNDRRLSKKDYETLLGWIDGGMAKGDDRDRPPPKRFAEGWRIGEPDLVVTMPKPFAVPAETPKGGVPYKYFSVDPGFREDKWVRRAEAKPGATEVVHHILIFILPPGESFNPDRPGATLCGTAPGDMPLKLPDGLAKKVPAGAKLIFQMHYTPNGKAREDRSSVGLVFAKGPPKHRVLTKPIVNRKFLFRAEHIPAGADSHEMTAEFTFKRDGHLVSCMPHMHLRGKDFRYEAVYPDGKTEVLLSVPRYNFNWQSSYRFAQPKAMPKGTKVRCTAHFDNSADNPHNPDPEKKVYWGDQTWQEMMVGWMDYYYDEPAVENDEP